MKLQYIHGVAGLDGRIGDRIGQTVPLEPVHDVLGVEEGWRASRCGIRQAFAGHRYS